MSTPHFEFVRRVLRHIAGELPISSGDVASAFEELLDLGHLLRGTQHPLGFAHFELTQLLDAKDRVRLHVWTSETMKWADDLGVRHDHTWLLQSGVLVGKLTDVRLDAVPDVAGPFRVVGIEYRDEGNRAKQVAGRWRLEERSVRTVSAGASYSLPVGAVHTTIVDELPAATLVRATPTELQHPRVFVPIDDSEATSPAFRAGIDPAWIRDMLGDLRDRAKNNPDRSRATP